MKLKKILYEIVDWCEVVSKSIAIPTMIGWFMILAFMHLQPMSYHYLSQSTTFPKGSFEFKFMAYSLIAPAFWIMFNRLKEVFPEKEKEDD